MSSDMGEVWNQHREEDKKRKKRNLDAADPSGWTTHTQYHWSRTVLGARLDYWPSRNKFQYKGQIYTGDVQGFIRNLEKKKPTR